MILTFSSTNTFDQCPRLYRYLYIDKRVKILEKAALSFGKSWHKMLEGWWRPNGETRIQSAVAKIENENIEPQDVAKLIAMISTYNPPADLFEVHAIEKVFEMPIINPSSRRPMRDTVLTGKIDLVLMEKANGRKIICEHKTTSDGIIGFGPYWQRLTIDHQLSIYADAEKATSTIYDAVKKPTIKMCGKDDNDPLKYQARCIEQRQDVSAWHQWREINVGAEEVKECRFDVWQTAHLIRDCINDGCYPRKSRSCRGLYGTCEYLDVCTGNARLDDDTIFRTKNNANE